MISDPRVKVVAEFLEAAGIDDADHVARLSIAALEEFYGSKRYWMAGEFERERIIREVELSVPRCECECCLRVVDNLRRAL